MTGDDEFDVYHGCGSDRIYRQMQFVQKGEARIRDNAKTTS